MITASNLHDRVGILKPNVARDTFGSQAVTYVKLREVWANVKFNKGRLALEHGELWIPTTVVITMRIHPEVDEHVRLTWESKTYQITSLNKDVHEGSLTITATTVDEGTDPHDEGSGSGSGE